VVLTGVAVATLFLGWAGILFVDGATAIGVLLALVTAGATALGLGVVLTSVRGTARLGAAALVGVLAATFALPELSVFMHGYVVSSLPGTVARLAAEAALVAGASMVIVALPSVLELLEQLDPPRPKARS
jgi:hypothetical protein